MPVLSAPDATVENVISSMASSRGPTTAKKPSVVLFVLSWMLTPSSVMLIVLCGRPLTIESRDPDAVCTPGRKATKSNALRLESGRFVTWRVSSVVEIDAVCVWISAAFDCTMTCSDRPPTSSTARTLAGTPALTMTLFSTTVLNPCSDTVTV